MIGNGIARPSSSPWGSNVILVKKRDGSTRFVIDYRQLNDLTIKDSYPMPNLRDVVDKMSGSLYFSKMDMTSVYWAVPIREEDREKTVFMTPRHLLEMCVTAYGLCNSQATYQRVMDKTLESIGGADSFVDDILQHSYNFETMLMILRSVFMRLQEANLQIRIYKCKFRYSSIEFCGYTVTGQGGMLVESNVNAIKNFPVPNNKKELERFTGMVGYYREFIKGMAEISEPLNRLRREGQPFIWTGDCQKAFESLRTCLVELPVLTFPDWREPFYLEADASDVSVGRHWPRETRQQIYISPLDIFLTH